MPFMHRLNQAVESRSYRVILAVFGGYAFTAGFFAILSVALVYAGATRVEGMWWGVLTSFVVYTALVIWAAATRRVWLTSAIIIVGAAMMIIASPILAVQLELAATT
ncbi:MAG: iron uptake protein [Pseudomonadota bacterium]